MQTTVIAENGLVPAVPLEKFRDILPSGTVVGSFHSVRLRLTPVRMTVNIGCASPVRMTGEERS